MRLLITGGTGFLGKHIQAVLKQHEKKCVVEALMCPTSKELDLLNPTMTMDYFDYHRPNVIIHAAAIAGGIKKNMMNPFDMIHLNLKMSVNLFDAIRKYGINYICSLGTVCGYPKHCLIPFKESNLFTGKPESTNMPYAISKRALFMLQNSYQKQYKDLKGAHLLVLNLYGPYDHFNDPENSHVIPGLIYKFNQAIVKNYSAVNCWGNGTATRSFLHAREAAEVIVNTTLNQIHCPDPINIGTEEEISIRNLAITISDLIGFKRDIVFTGEVSDGQPRRKLDISRAKEILGWEAKIPLRKGLDETIKWYKNDFEKKNRLLAELL